MAADQRKRRLNSSPFVGCSFREQREPSHTKKKKLGPTSSDLNVRCNISLEWDDKSKSVVAKKEQIGILRRDLVPFVDAVSHGYECLADIITVPHETFELKDFAGVLSYEVTNSVSSCPLLNTNNGHLFMFYELNVVRYGVLVFLILREIY